ncbi:hypothetical protein CcCBS67573_g07344 [Chytriomyces confervae]|uniref:Uncharacterized protein n=1 Tax=Chytriomyces confervae TaxID=246404 RepID=A0A507EVR1_9FUNG|nr:hypothetical protein CcCBS67573_g07344 [Chytriomyces confervae]
MSSKRLVCSAHRLILKATNRQVTLQVTRLLNILDLFRDTDPAKEDAKKVGNDTACLSNCTSPALDSFINANSPSSKQAEPTSTSATAAESNVTNSSVEIDEDDHECDDNDKCELQIIEHNLNRMADYNPLQGCTTGQAINEWYEMFHVPKVYLDPSKKSGGILEFRVLGDQTKSLSTTFGQSKTVSSTAILVLISKFGSASSNSIETPLIASLSFFGSLSTHERNKEAEGGRRQDGTKKTVYAKDGWNLLDLAHSNNIELEGHVVMQKEFYEKLEEPSDEENDMLDLAFGLTET